MTTEAPAVHVSPGHGGGDGTRPRLAAIVEEYWNKSHADLIVTKLCDGYELLWTPLQPHVDVVSLYVNDPGPTDVGLRRAGARGIAVHGSLEEALTLGGSRLAVDGVVLIAERNERSGRPVKVDERGRPVDPRCHFFMRVARACADAGRPVPVFLDKQLGNTWAQARAVYDTAREGGIPLMAGSSVPVTVRCPPVQLPLGATVEEVVVVSTGFGEPPIFHTLELVQSMIERRQGHETGVASVQFLSGSAFWEAWHGQDRWSAELQDAALSALPHVDQPVAEYYERLRQRPGHDRAPLRTSAPPTGAEEAVLVEYLDGTRVTILLLTGYALRRSVAMRVPGHRQPVVTWTPTGSKLSDGRMVGPAVPERGEPKPLTWNFDHLAFFVDEFMRTGVSPFPVERTLLSTGVLDAAMTSRYRSGVPVPTPHLAIAYQPTGDARTPLPSGSGR